MPAMSPTVGDFSEEIEDLGLQIHSLNIFEYHSRVTVWVIPHE